LEKRFGQGKVPKPSEIRRFRIASKVALGRPFRNLADAGREGREMADNAGSRGAENTPEKVALDLLYIIAHLERRALHSGASEGWTSADRQWVLSTYTECIRAIRDDSQNRSR
jgi:hypothetical protein